MAKHKKPASTYQPYLTTSNCELRVGERHQIQAYANLCLNIQMMRIRIYFRKILIVSSVSWSSLSW